MDVLNITFPLGVLRILQSMEKCGFNGEVYDINNLRHSDDEIIKNLKKYARSSWVECVFLHCYPHLKRIAKIVRNTLPNAWVVVGGNIFLI